MNKNEECLLKFLEQPGRLDKTIDELRRFIFSSGNESSKVNFADFRHSFMDDNIITDKKFLFEKINLLNEKSYKKSSL